MEPEPEPEQSEPAAVFADVSEGDWFFEAVEYVSSAGLMQGVAPGQFAPDVGLSRAMFWTVLARAEGVDTDARSALVLLRSGMAADCGISDCTEPEASITREQLVRCYTACAVSRGTRMRWTRRPTPGPSAPGPARPWPGRSSSA